LQQSLKTEDYIIIRSENSTLTLICLQHFFVCPIPRWLFCPHLYLDNFARLIFPCGYENVKLLRSSEFELTYINQFKKYKQCVFLNCMMQIMIFELILQNLSRHFCMPVCILVYIYSFIHCFYTILLYHRQVW
jgi:hypothetical protein